MTYDERFSYCLHVPPVHRRLAVVVHGSERNSGKYRDCFSSFAEEHDCIVLAPLFPDDLPDADGYKYLRRGEFRYDEILLAMVREVADRYRVDAARFLMSGFSGGAHFAHRFLYLHPDRLLGASIAAPGAVTLLDSTRAWPAGIADVEEHLRCKVDPTAVATVPVQLVVGGNDLSTDGIATDRAHPAWIADVNDTGVPRPARLEALRANLTEHDVRVRHDVVPGVGHDFTALAPTVHHFFTTVLG